MVFLRRPAHPIFQSLLSFFDPSFSNSFLLIHLIIYLDKYYMFVVLCYLIVRRQTLRFPYLPAISLPFHARHSRPSKSHQIISFADPRPLTPLQSYRFKNRGEGGHSDRRQPLLCRFFFLPNSAFLGVLSVSALSSVVFVFLYFLASLPRYFNLPKG